MIIVQCRTFRTTNNETYILDEPWWAIQRHFRDVCVDYTWSILVLHQNPRPACATAIELCHWIKRFVLIPNIWSTLQWLWVAARDIVLLNCKFPHQVLNMYRERFDWVAVDPEKRKEILFKFRRKKRMRWKQKLFHNKLECVASKIKAINAHSLDSLPTLARCNNQTVAVKRFQCVQIRLNFHSPLDCTFGHNFFLFVFGFGFRIHSTRFQFIHCQFDWTNNFDFFMKKFSRLSHLDSNGYSVRKRKQNE